MTAEAARPTDSTPAVHAWLLSMDGVRDELGEFQRELWTRHPVPSVARHDAEARAACDFGVSVSLDSGAAVDFWIELEIRRAGWRFRHVVYRHDPDEDGSHAAVEFPEQSGTAIDDLAPALVAALRELRAAARSETLYR